MGKILESVLDEFKNLAAIPRPSKHEEKVSNFLHDYLKSYGFEVTQDEVKNIVAEIPAICGKENVPRTILQAHMDMVCVAKENYKFNPLEDAIKLIRTEDYLTAEGTSLGADDGMGIAEILYIAKNHENFSHGSIRIIFTVDEEQGMSGAMHLDEKYLNDAKFFINCDSEIFDEIVVGSAGNIHVDFSRRINYIAPKFPNAYKIKLGGLIGGHSGIEINQNHHNAIKIAAKFLYNLKNENIQLAKFQGGYAPNVISSEAEIIIVTDLPFEKISERAEFIQLIYRYAEPNFKIEVTPATLPPKVFSAEDLKKFVSLILTIHSGIYSIVGDMPVTSANIGVVRTAENVEVNILARSNISALIEDFKDVFTQLAELTNFNVKFGNPAPAWNFNSDSKLLKIMAEIFEHQNNFAPKVHTSHGGLECSFFAVKNPNLDIVSIGTTNENIHSPQERLHLKTIEPQVNLIIETLKKIAE